MGAAAASGFGAAGSLVVLLVWVDWSAQVFPIGAEFTRLVAERYGAHSTGRLQRPENTSQGTPPSKSPAQRGCG